MNKDYTNSHVTMVHGWSEQMYSSSMVADCCQCKATKHQLQNPVQGQFSS